MAWHRFGFQIGRIEKESGAKPPHSKTATIRRLLGIFWRCNLSAPAATRPACRRPARRECPARFRPCQARVCRPPGSSRSLPASVPPRCGVASRSAAAAKPMRETARAANCSFARGCFVECSPTDDASSVMAREIFLLVVFPAALLLVLYRAESPSTALRSIIAQCVRYFSFGYAAVVPTSVSLWGSHRNVPPRKRAILPSWYSLWWSSHHRDDSEKVTVAFVMRRQTFRSPQTTHGPRRSTPRLIKSFVCRRTFCRNTISGSFACLRFVSSIWTRKGEPSRSILSQRHPHSWHCSSARSSCEGAVRRRCSTTAYQGGSLLVAFSFASWHPFVCIPSCGRPQFPALGRRNTAI